MAWDILLVLTSVAGNLCNKCPSGYLNKTAVQVILSMRSLVSIEQQSPRRPCDIIERLKIDLIVCKLSLFTNETKECFLCLHEAAIKSYLYVGDSVQFV